jgi:hypothetical protein
MGNKNAGKREKKKPAKTQTKAAPVRRQDEQNSYVSRIVPDPTKT